VIEAELKARLHDPDSVRAALDRLAQVEKATYRDTYHDTPDRALGRAGRELRLRSIETDGVVRHVLTFKEAAVDEESGSKPEYETTVATPDAVAHMVTALGYGPALALTKLCENYRFASAGREFLATVVVVPEIDGTWLEVETMAEEDEVGEALRAVRTVLADLGVAEEELTSELYTAAVIAART
jgi:adenylate cyclase class 2